MDKEKIKNIVREVLSEIKVNNPNIKFPLEVTPQNWDRIHKQLDKEGYKWLNGVKLKANWNNGKDFKYYLGFYNKEDKQSKLLTISKNKENFDLEGIRND